MMVDGREIGIDKKGAAWAYTLGFRAEINQLVGCPFIEGTEHEKYWLDGFLHKRFVYG